MSGKGQVFPLIKQKETNLAVKMIYFPPIFFCLTIKLLIKENIHSLGRSKEGKITPRDT